MSAKYHTSRRNANMEESITQYYVNRWLYKDSYIQRACVPFHCKDTQLMADLLGSVNSPESIEITDYHMVSVCKVWLAGCSYQSVVESLERKITWLKGERADTGLFVLKEQPLTWHIEWPPGTCPRQVLIELYIESWEKPYESCCWQMWRQSGGTADTQKCWYTDVCAASQTVGVVMRKKTAVKWRLQDNISAHHAEAQL